MNTTTRTTRQARTTAWYAARRHEGVPTLVTGHEAHRLTAGRVGTTGDHSTPFRLADLAKAVTR